MRLTMIHNQVAETNTKVYIMSFTYSIQVPQPVVRALHLNNLQPDVCLHSRTACCLARRPLRHTQEHSFPAATDRTVNKSNTKKIERTMVASEKRLRLIF